MFNSYKRILVFGGRNYSYMDLLLEAIQTAEDKLPFDSPPMIIHGGARGADTLGETIAKRAQVPSVCFPAQWDIFGKSAGYKRNSQMLNEGNPHIGVCATGGKASAMMLKLLQDANIPVVFTADYKG